eukprot:TRINITY_DN5957_c0_g1_i3.p1 TRINITY_DN5957_c0_g1~~TRINITY_DN5957_c0_g1_i3.p1  ORF type:complete len:579 (-),score=146.99 TRINITY_DN5957_c0_g1_i3:200-1693(-)
MEADEDERTKDISQKEMLEHVNLQTASKMFDLDLDQGPYSIAYTLNGRHLALAGKQGHVAVLDWVDKSLQAEFHVNETVRDVTFLHHELMFAVAQKKYTYIYDQHGTQLHLLKQHIYTTHLEFLRYHFLLASMNVQGEIAWQDVTLGTLVGNVKTKGGTCMKQNPYNAVLCVGQNNGVVTMWSPTSKRPLAEISSHATKVNTLAIDRTGQHLVTSGMDGYLNIWDIRKFGEVLHTRYVPPPTSIDISQTGVIACGYLHYVKMFNMNSIKTKNKSYLPAYMAHEIKAKQHITNVQFVPYEDVLGIGHYGGFSSIVIPGSGDPNYDTSEDNPFQTAKARSRAEIKNIIEKLQPDMIVLNPESFGTAGHVERIDPKDETSVPILSRTAEARKKEKMVKKRKFKKTQTLGSQLKSKKDAVDEANREEKKEAAQAKMIEERKSRARKTKVKSGAEAGALQRFTKRDERPQVKKVKQNSSPAPPPKSDQKKKSSSPQAKKLKS